MLSRGQVVGFRAGERAAGQGAAFFNASPSRADAKLVDRRGGGG